MGVIWLITGVMASGKSTVSQILAQRLVRAVHLRGDVFRKMIVSGGEEMSSAPSDEAVRQLHLRYRLAADAAKAYCDAGFDVVLQDNYYGAELKHMLELLAGYPVRTVVLCPSAEAVRARELGRGKRGYVGFDVADLHEAFMRETPRIGLWIDSSDLTAEETVVQILTYSWKK